MKAFKIAIAAGMAFALTACEWDNSDKYTNTVQENAGTPSEPDAPEEDIEPSVRQLKGRTLLQGYLSNAEVCADLNMDRICQADEPKATTNQQGRFEIDVPSDQGPVGLIMAAKEGVAVDQATGQAISSDVTSYSMEYPDRDNQVISPLTDLVIKEMAKGNYGLLEQAHRAVQITLGTSTDLFSDYVAQLNSDSSVEKANGSRLERLASTLVGLQEKINSSISDTDLIDAGFTAADRDTVVQDRADHYLPDIVADVESTLSEDTFDLIALLEDITYQDAGAAPAPKTLDALDFRGRAASGSPTTIFFDQDGFETRARLGSEVYKMLLLPHPIAKGQAYYEVIRRVTTATDIDTAETAVQEILPARDEFGTIRQFNLAENPFVCYVLRCGRINIGPDSFNTLMWTGSAFREVSIKRGNRGALTLAEGGSDGEVIALAYRGSLPTMQSYKEIDLEGLSVRSVLQEIYNKTLPANILGGLNQAQSQEVFGAGEVAYSYRETSIGEMTYSRWPGGRNISGDGLPFDVCLSPGNPLVMDVGSCNIVYGHTPVNAPAQNLSQLMYPSGALGSPVTGQFIGINGPGAAIYAMRLFGNPAANEGSIQIERELADGSWQIITSEARWVKSASPFPNIKLELPDGYRYDEARAGFETGTPILYERGGYVRHGWQVPEGLDAELLFGYRPTRFMFNKGAIDTVHSHLLSWGVLESHPYFWEDGMDVWYEPSYW